MATKRLPKRQVPIDAKGAETPEESIQPVEPAGKGMRGIDKKSRERAALLQEILNKYITGKAQVDSRIIENDRWYRLQHWQVMQDKGAKLKAGDPDPVTAYLFNTIANRHGDLMDAYPEPVFTEREESDKEEAEKLNKVVKVILERGSFNPTYSRNAWYKIKAGTACYGVFWDQKLENGLGDITVKKVDILRVFWEPGIEDVNESRYFFSIALIDADLVKKAYPHAEKFISTAKDSDYKSYNETDQIDITNKAMVVDAYYREQVDGGVTVLHMDKICSGVMLDSTKWVKEGSDQHIRGLYWHGEYPFVFDVMFPEEHNILGFGLVDVIKNPQIYIDKLDAILAKNAMVAGKYRLLVKRSGSIDPKDLADLSKDVIMADGNLREGEDYAVLQAEALPTTVMQHRQNKINELKEVSGANDFNRGASSGGVTAASAIMALQEAGNKLSRAMVNGTYVACAKIYHLIMELIAQYYDDARSFRITNEQGKPEYIQYNNAGIREQQIPSEVDGGTPETKRPIIDVTAHAEKMSPYAALARNEMAKEMFAAGFFNPETIPAALIALSMMTFDGKDAVEQKLQEMLQQQQAIQQAQTEAQQEIAANKDVMIQMNELIKKLTGKDMLAGANIGEEAAMQQQAEMGGQMV